VKNKYKGKTLQQLGRRLEENVLGTFVYVFFILVMQVCSGVVPYGTDKGVGVGETPAEEVVRISCRVIAVFEFRNSLFINQFNRIYVRYTNITLYVAFGIIRGFT
jgi:hypothetical protein